MNNTQYTIRSIPPKLDKALRERARKTGKSLNEVTLDTLSKGIGLKENAVFTDLDWLIGSESPDDNEFEENQKWLNSLPNNLDEKL